MTDIVPRSADRSMMIDASELELGSSPGQDPSGDKVPIWAMPGAEHGATHCRLSRDIRISDDERRTPARITALVEAP